MKLEVGKYYKTRDGRKVGPLHVYRSEYEMWHDPEGSLSDDTSAWWNSDGGRGGVPKNVDHDLISKWTDAPTAGTLKDIGAQVGPVITETVTLKRIVLGVYGHIWIDEYDKDMNMVKIGLLSNACKKEKTTGLSLGELIAARDVLNQIIDAMADSVAP